MACYNKPIARDRRANGNARGTFASRIDVCIPGGKFYGGASIDFRTEMSAGPTFCTKDISAGDTFAPWIAALQIPYTSRNDATEA